MKLCKKQMQKSKQGKVSYNDITIFIAGKITNFIKHQK